MSTFAELAGSLVRRLEEELRLYGELEDTLKVQIHALSRGEVEDLGRATFAVETCNDLLLGAERRRNLLMKALAAAMQTEAENLSLRRVAEHAPPDTARRLQQVGLRLRLRLRDVVRLREQTSSLLTKESRFNRERLNWLVEQLREDRYASDGSRRGRVNRRPMIDRRA